MPKGLEGATSSEAAESGDSKYSSWQSPIDPAWLLESVVLSGVPPESSAPEEQDQS